LDHGIGVHLLGDRRGRERDRSVRLRRRGDQRARDRYRRSGLGGYYGGLLYL
jgi:hypothetical protein